MVAGEALRHYAHHLDAEGRVPLNFGCFLLRADGRTVLVDTGNGPEADGTLMAQLSEAGVQPGDIDTVVFTHLHGDRVGFDRTEHQILRPHNDCSFAAALESTFWNSESAMRRHERQVAICTCGQFTAQNV